MLVLTRKLMEKLYIGEDICVTVVRVEGGQVRLGIDAPRHVPVIRAELKGSPRRERTAPRDDHRLAALDPDRSEPIRPRPTAGLIRGSDSRRRGPSR